MLANIIILTRLACSDVSWVSIPQQGIPAAHYSRERKIDYAFT